MPTTGAISDFKIEGSTICSVVAVCKVFTIGEERKCFLCEKQ